MKSTIKKYIQVLKNGKPLPLFEKPDPNSIKRKFNGPRGGGIARLMWDRARFGH